MNSKTNHPPVPKVSRRRFLQTTSSIALSSLLVPNWVRALELSPNKRIRPCGPASKYVPKLKVAFVRRKEAYGMWWPGQIYDGEAALQKYQQYIQENAQALGMQVALRPEPIYSIEAADQWLAEAKAQSPDGLLLVTLDRQQHTWPTVQKASESGLPTVVISPIGSSFTTNTFRFAHQDGIVIFSTDDLAQVRLGMKLIQAGTRLRESRFLIIKGEERFDTNVCSFGTQLRYIPAQDFIDAYQKLPLDDQVQRLGTALIQTAQAMNGPTKTDVFNGIKSYFVTKSLLEREECDGISMDCLGALANLSISLPCIAWSYMNDHGLPAACEADLGAMMMHALVQYLFDRPGFQQDPVAETSRECLIGAHCTCPTKLNGFNQPGTAYTLVNHHGKRDATIRPLWKIGQRVTVADLIASDTDKPGFGQLKTVKEVPANPENSKPTMLISTGEVVDNIAVPPAGGCVVSVAVRLDGVSEMLDFPGFHQLFFYGDFKNELKAFCQLFGIHARVV